MKSDVLLELLEGAADQLGIKVSYEPLQTSGIGDLSRGLRGGLCRVKGVYRIIIDKRATNEERVATLASALAGFDTTELELHQKVRDFIRMHESSTRADRSTRVALDGRFGAVAGPVAGPGRAA